jgi:photosystem II stability/assembly factor-like uncharacterized protein
MSERSTPPSDRAWDDGRLAEAYRALAERPAPAKLTEATLAATALAPDRKRRGRLGFAWPELRRPRTAVSLLGLTATIVLASGLLLVVANRGGQAAAGPSQAVDTKGQFQLTFDVPRTDWHTGDSITGEATLSYLGSGGVGIGSSGGGPIGFLFDEVGGSRHMGGAWTSNLVMRQLYAGKPITSPIGKSGAFTGEDPNAAFYRSFFNDPLVHLPAGDWTISAIAEFQTGSTTAPDHHSLRASVLIHVTGPAVPSGSTITIGATPSATIPASVSKPPSEAPSLSPASVAEIGGIAFFDAQHGLLVGGSDNSGALEPGGSGVLWRTDDGGTTWTKTALGTTAVWSVATVGPAFAWAGAVCATDAPPDCQSALLASADGGQTWSTISSEAFDTLDFVDANDGWGTSPLRHTTDGGRTWSNSPAQPCPAVASRPVGVSFVDAKRGWVACSGDSVGTQELRKAVVGTTDGGRTWTVLASAYVTTPDVGSIPGTGALLGIAMRPNGTGLIWMPIGAVDGTWRTVDGGRTWIDMRFGANAGDYGALAGCLVDDHLWLLVLEGGDQGRQIVRSTDGGTTWQEIATPK